jgi:acetyl-CoA carboxylase biotin carboxyl carrier protein
MDLEDIKQILTLIREHELAEFELERDGLKLRIRKAGAYMQIVAPVAPVATVPVTPAPPVPVPPTPTQVAAGPVDPDGVNLAVIKSPIVGTLYRAPEPGAAPFVEVGDVVRKGQVLCIIEAMKLMNEIESDVDGEITAIYVENGRPVQFGDRLFAVRVS